MPNRFLSLLLHSHALVPSNNPSTSTQTAGVSGHAHRGLVGVGALQVRKRKKRKKREGRTIFFPRQQRIKSAFSMPRWSVVFARALKSISVCLKR